MSFCQLGLGPGVDPISWTDNPEAAELDMAVAVQLHLSPNSQFRRHVRQRAQDVLFRLGKQRQRLGLGCAVGAIPRIAHDPFQKLRVGVMEAAKGPCRQEVDFDGLHPRLDPALFLRFTRRAGRNQKAIRLGKGLIGALDLRIVVAGLGDGALGIVDDDPGWDAAEKLERPAMTAKPGLDLLVAYDLRVLMPAPGQRHHEEMRLDDFAGHGVGDLRAGPEIHLHRLARCKIQHHRGFRWRLLDLGDEASDAGIRAREAVLAHQGLVDRAAGNALPDPVPDFVLEGDDAGRGWLLRCPAGEKQRQVPHLAGNCRQRGENILDLEENRPQLSSREPEKRDK